MSEKMKCKICGKEFKKVLSHVWQKHDMLGWEYREKFGYDRSGGLISKEAKEHMAKLTRENGTINNLKLGAKFRFKKGVKNDYVRRPETLRRLKTQFKVMNEALSKKK